LYGIIEKENFIIWVHTSTSIPPEKPNIKLDNENVIMKTIMQALIINALKIQSLLALIPVYVDLCRGR